MLLPGVIPRVRHLFGSGLVSFAWVLALIFSSVRLLPWDHPYLNPANIGRYGIRHVLAEAASKLVFARKNIDQVIVYFTILTGIVILFVQFGLLISAILSNPALAQARPDIIGGYSPDQDIAFVLLDKIFGVKGIFNSCISTGADCLDRFGRPLPKPASFPYPMHHAVHQLLGFYAIGIGIISLMVILYQMTTVIGETAVTGTPFGQRYNRAWAPVRMILFFALLAPLNIGNTDGKAWLNGAQLLTLWTAKWGSDAATNGWFYFNEKLSHSYIGKPEELIATPHMPKLSYLGRFFLVMHTCRHAYQIKTADIGSGITTNIDAYLIRSNSVLSPGGTDNSLPLSGVDFEKALEWNDYSNITIRFGSKDKDLSGKTYEDNPHKGGVYPACGELTLNIGDVTQPGSRAIARVYYEMIQGLYKDDPEFGNTISAIIKYVAACYLDDIVTENFNGCKFTAGADAKNVSWNIWQISTIINTNYQERLAKTIQLQVEKGDFTLPETIKRKGWAGAAIWYNTIAEMNGAITGALVNSPTVIKYPEVMHYVEEANTKRLESLDPGMRFDPGSGGREEIKFPRAYEYEIARALNNAYTIFSDSGVDETPDTKKTENKFIDAINMLFGTTGIYDILENKSINPLAQLSSLGKAMTEQALRNFGLALGFGVGDGLATLIGYGGGDNKSALGVINDFLETIFTIGILIGFILYYILPFMPFLYFFFALGEWAKAIFEGMVAMPLWALAHLTIEGQGLPGPAASNGYYLLFEIFARPILCLCGLIGSVLAFSTLVNVLNDIFGVVVENVSGAKPPSDNSMDMMLSTATVTVTPSDIEYYRGPVDEFFFTVLYTVLCYMIALSCFKMIDSIPLSILRWMGSGVQTYQQLSGNRNPVESITSNVYRSGAQTIGQLQQGLTGSGMSGATAQALMR
ncbi:MAG: DotA/TraY family protein [Alphaproteobacteria bacterium]|nr:DotA/TraY family protein [Alphaproteobacteria bacterium]